MPQDYLMRTFLSRLSRNSDDERGILKAGTVEFFFNRKIPVDLFE